MSSKSSKNTNDSTNKKSKLIIVAVILSVLIVASSAIAVMVFFSDELFDSKKEAASDVEEESSLTNNTSSEPNVPDDTSSSTDESSDIVINSSYEVTAPDADKFFNDVATIVSKSEAFGSPDVRTESQVFDDFYQRGFKDDITTEYMMNGDLEEMYTISRYSSLNHPVYQTYYTTSAGDLWLIVEINGAIMATPVFYNISLESEPLVMLSETDTITSYDSTTNQFYVVIPNSDEINLVTIGTINSEALENYKLGGNQ